MSREHEARPTQVGVPRRVRCSPCAAVASWRGTSPGGKIGGVVEEAGPGGRESAGWLGDGSRGYSSHHAHSGRTCPIIGRTRRQDVDDGALPQRRSHPAASGTPSTATPTGRLYFEELMGEEGFSSDSSLLYHRGVPSALVDSRSGSSPTSRARPTTRSRRATSSCTTSRPAPARSRAAAWCSATTTSGSPTSSPAPTPRRSTATPSATSASTSSPAPAPSRPSSASWPTAPATTS